MTDSVFSFTDYVESDEFAEVLDDASSGVDAEYLTDEVYSSDDEVVNDSVIGILTQGIKRFNPNRYLQGDEHEQQK